MKRLFSLIIIWIAAICSLQGQASVGQSAGTTNAFTKVEPPARYLYRSELNTVPTAKFAVSFSSDFPDSARTAFLRATEVWSYLISAQESIHITADWRELSGTTLASAAPDSFFKNFPNAPKANAYYTVALAEAISHQNLNGSKSEIKVNVDSGRTDWYFGTDGNVPAYRYDLVTAIMHELAHGFGFYSSFNVDGSNGYWGTVNGYSGYKMAMDDPCIVGMNHGTSIYHLTNTSTYANPSIELGDRLKGGNIYFDGDNVYRIAGNSLVKLYAPNPWNGGSSIDHLERSLYPAGSSNALMTQKQDFAEATHSPGELGLAILQDLGWNVNRAVTITWPTAGTVWQKNTTDTVEWTDNKYLGGILSVQLWKKNINGTYSYYSTIGTANSNQGSNKSFIWNANVDTGMYRLKMLDENEGYGYSNAFAILEEGVIPPVFPPGTPYVVVTNISPTEIPSGQSTVTTTITYTNQFKWVVPSCTPEQKSIVAIKIDGNTFVDYFYSATSGSYTVSFTLGAGPHTLTFVEREIENGKCPGEIGYYVETYRLPWNFNITYGPAPVTLDQKTQEGNHVGTIGVWNGSSFNPRYTPSTTLPFAWHSTQFVHADTNLFSSQKYNNWSKARDNFIPMPDVINRHSFYIDTNITDTYQSNLKPTADATLQIQVDGINTGNVYFQDPWLIDSVDYSHGNARMNRGKDNSLFRSVAYATNNLGTTTNYKGVILNQGGPDANNLVPPYYSIRALAPSDYTSTFLGWSVTSGNASFQNASTQQTAVVFKQANTTVTAKYKGKLRTGRPDLADTKNQRRIFSNGNNWAMVYESMGEIWLSSSGDNGNTWTENGKLSGGTGAASNPSISNVVTSYSVTGPYSVFLISWLENNKVHLQTMNSGEIGVGLYFGWVYGGNTTTQNNNNHVTIGHWTSNPTFYIPCSPTSTARPVIHLNLNDAANLLLTFVYENVNGGIVSGQINLARPNNIFVNDINQGTLVPFNGYNYRTVSTHGSDQYPVIIQYSQIYGYPGSTYIFYLAGGYASGRRVACYDYLTNQNTLLNNPNNDYTYFSLQGAVSPTSGTYGLVAEATNYSYGYPPVSVANFYFHPTYYGTTIPGPNIVATNMVSPSIMFEQRSGFNTGWDGAIVMKSTSDNNFYQYNYYGSLSQLNDSANVAGVFTKEQTVSGDRTSMLVKTTISPAKLEKYSGSGLAKSAGGLAV
ncbi:MAG: hypothetical protein Q8L88_04150, partial [Bacteroidota bacterium]|nr:hypothetical protein [Bacteroidota bacterium]